MKSLQILVIDDEPFICELIVDMLQGEGHTVTTTTDSRQGLSLFQNNDYDIVFTDYRMPHLSGAQLAREMKSLKPSIPICLITGTLIELVPNELVDFVRVIQKPFTLDDLTAAIAQLFPSPAAGS